MMAGVGAALPPPQHHDRFGMLGVRKHVHHGERLDAIPAAKQQLNVAALRLRVARDVPHALRRQAITPFRNCGVEPARGGSMITASNPVRSRRASFM